MKTTYRATLCNAAGALDFVSADSLENLARRLSRRLINKSWLLDDGDTITITSGDAEQVT